jgi:very-short-patch-repair endonuclease
MIKKFKDCHVPSGPNERYKQQSTAYAQSAYNKWYDNGLKVDEILNSSTNTMSLLEICTELNYSYHCIYKFLKNYSDIVLTRKSNGSRPKDLAGARNRAKHFLDKSYVENLYLTEMKSLSQIALILKCDNVTVFKFCKANDIPLRSCVEGTKLYISQLSPEEKVKRTQLNVKRGINNYLNRRMHGTKPEIHFKEWLQTNNIKFIEQYRKVGNAHPYDFFLSERNLIVEIDGNYWHSKKEQRIKDIRFTRDALDKGYDIIRINTKDVDYKQSDYSKWI